MGYLFATQEQMDRLVDFRGPNSTCRITNGCVWPFRSTYQFVQDGDIFAETGFSYVRSPIQAYFEMLRQKRI